MSRRRNHLDRLIEARVNLAYQGFMLFLCLYALLALSAEVLLPKTLQDHLILDYADYLICFVFFVDFLLNLKAAENKWRYLRTWGWIDLLSSIPYVEALRVGRVARVLRILRLLRALKVSRFVVLHLIRQRKDAVLYGVGAIAFTLVIIASIAVLSFENVPQANIRSAGDALWWALCTISTVGYGDFYPVTWEGRIVAAILMTTGVGMIGVLSGTMVSWLVQPGDDREKMPIADIIKLFDLPAVNQSNAKFDGKMLEFQCSARSHTLVDEKGEPLDHLRCDFAFRATLEEVIEAELLLHVVDASSPEAAEHTAHVIATLQEIGADATPQILVLNKVDQLPEHLNRAMDCQRLPLVWGERRMPRLASRIKDRMQLPRFSQDESSRAEGNAWELVSQFETARYNRLLLSFAVSGELPDSEFAMATLQFTPDAWDSQATSMTFDCPLDGREHIYLVPVGSCPGWVWRARIKRLKLEAPAQCQISAPFVEALLIDELSP